MIEIGIYFPRMKVSIEVPAHELSRIKYTHRILRKYCDEKFLYRKKNKLSNFIESIKLESKKSFS